ncbi:hypothetical protein [Anabaena lutea]|uniref:Uncharacterized protein n=1 Tax=Anabaena lutea FACHB-196 TaxID=2692881 RepID=A0ABR8FMN1_9NOST|nr:hypothetical protein [Anabaena lutea]MBD2571064.1 hypothetical protein [Anabaena lutea FACHB-196]
MMKIVHNLNGQVTAIFVLIRGIYCPIPFNPETKEIDFNLIEYPPTRSSLQSAWEQWCIGKDLGIELADIEPSSIPPNPDWDELKNRILSGNLHPLFERLTMAAMQGNSPGISTAQIHISIAILNLKNEDALSAGITLLTQVAGYIFTSEEKTLWNQAATELGFSNLVHI